MNKLFYLLIIFLAFKAGAQTSALSIADSLYAVGKYAAAIEKLEQIEPKSETVYIRLAKAQEAGGKLDEALGTFRRVLHANPERILTALDYGKLLGNTGKLTQADSVFLSLIKKHPDNAAFHYQLALIREKQKDSTAMSHFNLTAILDQTHQPAIYGWRKSI